MEPQIPSEIEAKYEGRWIAWDTRAEQIVGEGETLEEALADAAQAREAGALIWYHHVLPRDTILVGGL
jgi:hypothetical protein